MIFVVFALFSFQCLIMNSALKASISRLSFSSHSKLAFSSQKNFLLLQGKKGADDGDVGNVKKMKNRKRWITDSQQDEEKLSRLDVLHSQGRIASLDVIEEALLNDISIFETIYPEERIPVEFQTRNERIKAGGELMGNYLEKTAHKNLFLQVNSGSNKDCSQNQHRRIYLDTVSSDHICSTAVSELQQISIKDLTKNSINYGKILWVDIEEPSYRFHNSSAITVLVKDNQGTLLSLALHNVLPPSATTRDAEKFLPVGKKIGIKEPSYKCFLSGFVGLRVDNPCNLEIECSNLTPDLKSVSFDPFQQDSVEDYYGPIEIRDAGNKGRGIYLTKDVREGEILLIEKAFGFQFDDENIETTVINLRSRTLSSGSHIALVNELVIAATMNVTVNNILSCLSSGIECAGPIPSIDFFRNGTFPSSTQLSASTIEGILNINCFEIRYSSMKGIGLWIVSSFCNHEINSNTVVKMSGKVKTIRAKKDLKGGTEITISYGSDSETLKKWGI